MRIKKKLTTIVLAGTLALSGLIGIRTYKEVRDFAHDEEYRLVDKNITSIPMGYNDPIRIGDKRKVYEEEVVIQTNLQYPDSADTDHHCYLGVKGIIKVLGFTSDKQVFGEYTTPTDVEEAGYMCKTGARFTMPAEKFKYQKCEKSSYMP